MLTRVALILTALFLSACATVPMTSIEVDAEGKSFKAPAQKSRIYVFRDETMGSAVKVTATIDGKVIGQTAPKTYFAVDVPPGDHVVSCMAETNSSAQVTTEKNKVYYVWQEMKMGLWTAGCSMQKVSEVEGQRRILACKRAYSQY